MRALGTMSTSGSSGPVSPTVAPYPPSTDYTCDDLRPARLICGRPARCKRYLKKIGTQSDAAIRPASDAAMELRACFGVPAPEPNHKFVLSARSLHLLLPAP